MLWHYKKNRITDITTLGLNRKRTVKKGGWICHALSWFTIFKQIVNILKIKHVILPGNSIFTIVIITICVTDISEIYDELHGVLHGVYRLQVDKV